MQCFKFNLVSSVLIITFALNTYASVVKYDFIKTCEPTSKNCLRDTLQATLGGFIHGIPELGVEMLDPFVVDNLNLTLPGGLTITFYQGMATGFRKCIIDSARFLKDTLEIHYHCNLTIKGKYKSSGRLLMFPIDGDGDATIKCKNMRMGAMVKIGSTMIDEQKHLEIRDIRTNHVFDGKVTYQMTNLIKGNPTISNLVLDFMNHNWKLVADEFGKPIVDFGVSSILRNIRQLFKMVPMKELIQIDL